MLTVTLILRRRNNITKSVAIINPLGLMLALLLELMALVLLLVVITEKVMVTAMKPLIPIPT